MITMTKPSRTLCLGCAHIFPSTETEGISCPACGFLNEGPTFRKLLTYATVAADYGYGYRAVYEEELEEQGEIPAYGMLPISEVFVWMALAALSGIVGGASWEIAGAAVRRIIKQAAKEKAESSELNAFEDEKEFKQFLIYIQDFVEGFRNTDPRVRSAVLTEMVINEKVRLHLEEGYRGAPEEENTLAMRRVKSILQDVPSKEDFHEVWKNIDLSG